MKESYSPVEGHPNLVRDNTSHAVINRNATAYEQARKRAADAQKQRDEIRDNKRNKSS